MTIDELLKKYIKSGDFITCVEKSGKKRVKNIFVFHDSIDGKIIANGNNVIVSMRNKYMTVLFSFKEASEIKNCYDIRLATEKEKVLFKETLKRNGLRIPIV